MEILVSIIIKFIKRFSSHISLIIKLESFVIVD